GNGDNKVGGEAMAVNTGGDAFAYANNTAEHSGSAGDDTIVTGRGKDIVSGDAQARDKGFAKADADNTATNADAGNDLIDVYSGAWNKSAGDAQAISSHGSAEVKATNTALAVLGSSRAGNDSITAGSGDDVLSGDAQAIAKYTATAEASNTAEAGL